jgi:hypothetical protein
MKTAPLRVTLTVIVFLGAVRLTLAQSSDVTPGYSVLAMGGPTHQFVEDPQGDGLIPVSPMMLPPGKMQPYGFLWTGFDATVEYDIYGLRRSQTSSMKLLDPLGLFGSNGSSNCRGGCASQGATIIGALGKMVKFREPCSGNCARPGCQLCDGRQSSEGTNDEATQPPVSEPDKTPNNVLPQVEPQPQGGSHPTVNTLPELADPPEPDHEIIPPRNPLPRNVLPKNLLDDEEIRSSRRNTKSRTVAAVGAMIKT